MCDYIKILQIGMGTGVGGIENFVMNYYRYINRELYHFDFADIYGAGNVYENEIKQMGGKLYTLSNCKKKPLKMARELAEIINENSYDIIHINMLSAANLIPVCVSCRTCRGDVIVHSHNSGLPNGIVRKSMHRININILKKFTVKKWGCGIKAGRWMWGDSFRKEDVIVNAIDDELFKKNSSMRISMRKQCDFQQKQKVIGFIGRLAEQKNPMFLLNILAELKKHDDTYKLLVVGDGVLRQQFVSKAAELKLQKDIYLAGAQKNVQDWYQAMDAFVLPSRFEGLPIVAIEAQASGLPCFFSDSVTDETNITGCVQYLPINQGACIWANRIIEFFEKGEQLSINFPEKYQIQYAVKILEEKYDEIVSRK